MTEETLFALALEKSAGAARKAFVDEACAGDATLRHRLEQLLAADQHPQGILEQSPGSAGKLAAFESSIEANPLGYELFQEVGEGGMGVVYRARDVRLARDVAIKLLHARFDAAGPAAMRFLGESRITAQLQHPGIPPVHQIGAMADGRPFLVMKLIKGRTLADILAGERSDRGRLTAVFEQVCQAVGFAHSHKVIHRDLKPSNIMVGEFGEVQVMDWGLAKVVESRTSERPESGEHTADAATVTADLAGIGSELDTGDATRAGSVLGTPAYMPPEQAIGAIDKIDERSDVFGLGAILCAILTGLPPYVGANFESTRQLSARARLDDAFTRLEGCGADRGLIELGKRCLAAEKADRPANAGEVARAVANLRAAADERARIAELDRVRAEGEQAKLIVAALEQRRRWRVQLALAAALGLILVGGGAFAWWQDNRRTRNSDVVAALLDQCENSIRGGRANQAAIAIEAAEGRAADGGAEGSKERLARLRAELRLFIALNEIDTIRWTWTDGKLPDEKVVMARMRTALSDFGVTPGEGDVQETAKRINGSILRGHLVTVLDLWLVNSPTDWVRDVLRAIDQDPYRNAVRDALAVGDRSRVIALAGQPDALGQHPGFAMLLAQFGVTSTDRQVALLESALRIRPGNLTLLMGLGILYQTTRPEQVAERVRWFQAAVSAHPNSAVAHNSLAVALRDKGDIDGATAELREAIRLDPGYIHPHLNLGNALRRKGDLEGALAEVREAIRLDQKFAAAHFSLGVVLMEKGDVGGAVAAYKEAVNCDSDFPMAHNNLAWILATGPDSVRNGKQAVEHARRAIKSSDRIQPTFLDTMAAAFAEAGEFDQAVEYQKKALSFPAFQAADGKGGRDRLQLYELKKPYHNPAPPPPERKP